MIHRMFHWFTACWHYVGERLETFHDENRIPFQVATEPWYKCCKCNRLMKGYHGIL